MKKPHLCISQGDAFQALGGSKFRKDVVRIGRWIHPVTGAEISFDAARLARLAENTERYRARVDKQRIPFPDGHSFRAQDNIGEVSDFKVDGDRLVATFEPSGKDIEEKLSSGKIRSVSAYIEFNAKDCAGNVYPEAITHVAATPYPVVTGQEDFVKLSAKDEAFDLFLPQELSIGGSDVLKLHDHLRKELQNRMDEHKAAHKMNGADHPDTKKAASAVQDAAHRLRRQAEVIHSHTMNATGGPTYLSNRTEGISPEGDSTISKEVQMDRKKMALALGLPEDASEEKILEAGAKLLGGRTALAAQLEKEFSLKLDGDKAVKLSAVPAAPSTDLEKQQAQELAQLKAEKALTAATAMAARIDGMVKSGIVPPAKKEVLSRLMSIPGKVQALALSKDAKGLQELQVDVSADVEELLKDLPGISTQRLSAGAGDDEKKADELSAKKVDEVAERIQPELAAKK